MRTRTPAWLAVLLPLLGAAAVHAKAPAALLPALKWTEPCAITRVDGAEYHKPLNQIQCDHLRSTIGDNAASTREAFNSFLPEDQESYLETLRDQSAKDYAAFQNGRKKLLADTSTEKLCGRKSRNCAEKLISARETVQGECKALAYRFLWPREVDTYVFRKPENRDFYLGPCDKRLEEIKARLKIEETMVVGAEKAKLEKLKEKLEKKAAKQAERQVAKDLESQKKGGKEQEATLAKQFEKSRPVAERGPGAPGRGLAQLGDTSVKGGSLSGPGVGVAAEAKKVPPSLPTPGSPEQDARGYFSRDYAGGIRRIKDDAKVELWHITGYSETVGDPDAKAKLTFKQQNNTCGVAAVAQPMWARGEKRPVAELTKEALDKNYYTEGPSRRGELTGWTYWEGLGGLAQDKGMLASKTRSATASDLQSAISTKGDAVVRTDAGLLYEHKVPANAGHFVYVTGMEKRKSDGTILGYYINDTNYGEGKRFMSTEEFERAWTGHMLTFQ